MTEQQDLIAFCLLLSLWTLAIVIPALVLVASLFNTVASICIDLPARASSLWSKHKDLIAFCLLLSLWTLAIVIPAEFGTVQPSTCLPHFPYACGESLELNDQVIGLNLGLVFGWPVCATIILAVLVGWLTRNENNGGY